MQILQNVWTALTTENEVILNITGIPFCFIEVYISMLLFTYLFHINSALKTRLLYVCTFSIIGFLTRYYIPNPYGTFINLIACPLLILLIFKTNISTAIFSEVLPLLLETIVDLILIKLFFIFFNISSAMFISIPLYRILLSICEYLLLYVIYLLIKKLHITIKMIDIKNPKQNFILILNSVLGIIAFSLQMYISIYYMHKLPFTVVLLSISTLILYFVINLYCMISTNKLNIAKQNLEETRLMNKTLTILNDKIRAFRHDFNNIIQAIGGYIQAKDMEGLEKYYSQLLKDCQEVNNLTGLNPESINNPAIYSLIASKYYLATEKGIEFDLDIFMDLTSIDMKIYEFCRILGILLDNAIQATQECEEKHIKVTIRKDNRCKRQLLIVENTYKEKDIDTEKIFEKGYSTKEGNTGLGLWEVRQILLKNTNLNLFTSKDDTYFKQQLEIYKS